MTLIYIALQQVISACVYFAQKLRVSKFNYLLRFSETTSLLWRVVIDYNSHNLLSKKNRIKAVSSLRMPKTTKIA